MSAHPARPTRTERKRAEQAAELRAEIVDAAFVEFAEQGYHRTTMSDIAARLDVSSGTLYNYFKNKRDIVDYVIDRLTNELLEALAAQAGAADETESAEEYAEQSRRIARAVDEVFAADWRIPRVLFFEAPSIDEQLSERILGLFDIAGQTAAAYLRNGIDKGFLRGDLDTAAVADSITGMMIAVAVRHFTSGPDSAHRHAHREAAVEILMNGIASRSH